MITVMVVDDNPVIRAGVGALLGDVDDVVVVGEAADGNSAIRVAAQCRPDVVLLDVGMPGMDGVQVAGRLSPHAKVMMLTDTDQSEQVIAAIRAGASGYLVYGTFGPDELGMRIRQLAAGDTVLSPGLVGIVLEALRRAPSSAAAPTGAAALSVREREIMHLISEGLTNGQIAARFVLSEKTVKNHVNRIYAKLGAQNRAHATALWLGTAAAV